MAERLLIAIGGDACTGKDSTGDIFEQDFGLSHVSCSNVLREHITDNHLGPLDRKTMTRVARDLRIEKGASFLVDCCLERYPEEDLAISGIYSPGEARRIKDVGGFIIVVFCRDDLLRFERIASRPQRPEELTYDDFLEAKRKENTGTSGQQDVAGLATMADFQIYNESTLDDLRTQVAVIHDELQCMRDGAHYAT